VPSWPSPGSGLQRVKSNTCLVKYNCAILRILNFRCLAHLPTARQTAAVLFEGFAGPGWLRSSCCVCHCPAWLTGRFEDDITAAKAYDKAAVYLYGSNAITNFGLEACQVDPTEVGQCIPPSLEGPPASPPASTSCQHFLPAIHSNPRNLAFITYAEAAKARPALCFTGNPSLSCVQPKPNTPLAASAQPAIIAPC
jgi:hypothetical protein